MEFRNPCENELLLVVSEVVPPYCIQFLDNYHTLPVETQIPDRFEVNYLTGTDQGSRSEVYGESSHDNYQSAFEELASRVRKVPGVLLLSREAKPLVVPLPVRHYN